MKITYIQEHCQHILVDGFMPSEDLETFNREFYQMYAHSGPGPYKKPDGLVVDTTIKARREFSIHDATVEHGLNLSHIWRKYLWSDLMKQAYVDCGGIFPYMNVSSYDYLLGAFYGPGDFYKPHNDLFILTAVFFHQDEENFLGGDFFLGNRVDKKAQDISFIRIPYVKNRLVIFPSRYTHYVEPVEKSLKPGIDGLRLCTQDFIDFNNTER